MTDKEQAENDGRGGVDHSRRGRYLIIGLLLLCLYGCFRIVEPYIHSIIMAALLASIFYPVNQYFLKKTRQHEAGAALLSCCTVAFVVVIPLMLFMSALAYKGVENFQAVKEWVQDGNLRDAWKSPTVKKVRDSQFVKKIHRLQKRFAPDLTLEKFDLPTAILTASQFIVTYIGRNVLPILQNVGLAVFNFLIMIFVMFYFFRDGKKILLFLIRLSPLEFAHERQLIDRVRVVTRSALLGTLMTAVVQGALGMIAFAASGIPWFFWGVALGVSSLIPVIGTALIWVPCVIYLLIVGKTGAAIGLALWCILVVGSSDNFLRVYFMQGDTGLSSLILFFSILGGIQLFGLVGVVYGPLVFGLAAVLIYIYQLDSEDDDEDVVKEWLH